MGVPATLIATFAIIAVAAAAQAVTGFGFALLAVPLLALVMPVNTAVVVGSIASLAMSVVTATRDRAHVQWRTATFIVAVAVVAMPLGLYLLVALPASALTGLVGASVLVSTFLVWLRPTLPDRRGTLICIGLLVGLLTTATGTNGPPLVAAFQSLGYGKQAFRATIAAVFVGCGIVSIGFFAYGRRAHGAGRASVSRRHTRWIHWLVGRRPRLPPPRRARLSRRRAARARGRVGRHTRPGHHRLTGPAITG